MTTKQKSETAVRSTGKKLRHPSGEQQKVGPPGGSRQNRLKAERVQEKLLAPAEPGETKPRNRK